MVEVEDMIAVGRPLIKGPLCNMRLVDVGIRILKAQAEHCLLYKWQMKS